MPPPPSPVPTSEMVVHKIDDLSWKRVRFWKRIDREEKVFRTIEIRSVKSFQVSFTEREIYEKDKFQIIVCNLT